MEWIRRSGAQSTLGRGAQHFCPKKICIKNQQNVRILLDSCPKKNYQNTRILHNNCPKNSFPEFMGAQKVE